MRTRSLASLALTPLLLSGALAACTSTPMDRMETDSDERSDQFDTQLLQWQFCGLQTAPLDFFFDSITLDFDGGSDGRLDTGTAFMVGGRRCTPEQPSIPCTREIVVADYSANESSVKFSPVQAAIFDESTRTMTQFVTYDYGERELPPVSHLYNIESDRQELHPGESGTLAQQKEKMGCSTTKGLSLSMTDFINGEQIEQAL